MKIFLVGGAVRDHVMGIECKDRDYVVVGSSPEEMLALGYSQVGADFPVFLHPETNEEYALARTERKSGRGYHGFVVDFSKEVTLEDDLERRDLTMNSMAMDLITGDIIDPFNGLDDIKNKVIRHTSEAFAEDPVRVLRTARFAARYNFTIHDDTLSFMKDLVDAGELNELTKERVWKEFEKGLMEKTPSVMIRVLRTIGADKALMMYTPVQYFPDEAFDHWMKVLDFSASLNSSLTDRFTLICGSPHKEFLLEWKIPNEQADICMLVDLIMPDLITYNKMDSVDKVKMFQKVDYYRRPERFIKILSAASFLALAAGYGGPNGIGEEFSSIMICNDAMITANIDAESIAKAISDKSLIKFAINTARVKALDSYNLDQSLKLLTKSTAYKS